MPILLSLLASVFGVFAFKQSEDDAAANGETGEMAESPNNGGGGEDNDVVEPVDETPSPAPTPMPPASGGSDDSDDDSDEVTPPVVEGSPKILVFGQSNAGGLYYSGTLQDQLTEMGSDAEVVMVARGATAVAHGDGDWNIITGDGTDAPGELAVDLMEYAESLEGTDAFVAGAIWVQGESDRSVGDKYYDAAKALFDEFQSKLDAPTPITIVSLSDMQTGGDGAGHQLVQDAQQQLADDLDYAHFIDIDQVAADSGMTEDEMMRDGLHYNNEFHAHVAEAFLDQPVMQAALGFVDDSDMSDGDMNDGGMDDGGMDDGSMDHGGMDDGHGDMGHADMGDYPTPPDVGATQSEIIAYLTELAGVAETHSHDHDSPLATEHTAAIDLMPRDDATHVAIANGDWDDPSIWSGGEVPGDNAQVLVPKGVTVSYGTVSDASLFTVRIDGKLEFETDTDSQMIFDTMLVAPGGHLEIGTVENPVQPDVDIDLIVANNGPIDVDWDPMLLSRGLISHGRADIHGAVKDSHEKVTEDPMAGDTSVTFAEAPEGWQVGDTIVIAGTRYDGHKWDHELATVRAHESEDEVRVISEIDGNTVHFEDELIHDHDTPRADLKTSVANYTRNVSIETEDAETAEVFERGHVMFMHSDEVEVRYAEFHELGRTDKSEDSFPNDHIDNITFDSNVQGRYALHLHRTGVSDQDNPTMVEGNAVFGSPGWGVVHHDSHAIIDNNATFDTFGAGYVAETGNETGAWTDNIAIYAEGQGWGKPKHHVELENFDAGRSGDGFWFQGRLVETFDNVAASVNHGYVFFHRDGDDRMIDANSEHFEFGDALDGEYSTADDIPIRAFADNETFAANEGMHVVKANPNQEHDVWSHLENLTAWEVKTGAYVEYTSHYVLSGFDVIGKEPTAFSPANAGLEMGPNATEIVWVDSTITNFPVGVHFEKAFVGFEEFGDEDHDFFLVNATMIDVDEAYEHYDPTLDTVVNGPVSEVTPSLELDGPLTFHTDWTQADGRIIEIDGTKTDSLGTTNFPGGTDNFDFSYGKVVNLLETDGYWTTSEDQNYTVIDVFVTDRLTGDVFVEKHPVYLADNVALGNEFFAFRDAKDNGVQDIVEMQDGTLMAGDIELGVAKLAVPWAHLEDQSDAAASEMTMLMSMTAEDVMSSLAIEPSEEGHQMHNDAMAEIDELALL